MLKPHTFKIALFCAVVSAFGGCVGRRAENDPKPLAQSAAPFREAPASGVAEVDWQSPWWAVFGDETLNQLTATALGANLGLEQFVARIDQAQALLRQSRAGLLPSLGVAADAEHQWTQPENGGSQRNRSTSLAGLLDWELDVWGRLRAARKASEHASEISENDLLSARLLLSASVAETYFEILEQRQQLQLIRAQMKANETLLSLTRLRFAQGQSSIVDLLQQQEQLAATASLLPSVEARVGELEYSLDVLVGAVPGTRPRFERSEWSTPPPIPETGLHSDLLRRRPDILAAENLVRSLDHRVSEAIAARLPRVAIGAAGGALGDPGYAGLVASVFANLTAPVFDGGLRKAEVDLQRARLREAAADWSERYLSAIRDVETALVRERKQHELVERTEEQLDIARQLLRETRNRYSQGLTDYLPVLNAVVTQQNLERETLRTRRDLLAFRVALHRAMGGPMPPMSGRQNASL